MVEGHQQLPALKALPVSELVEWAAGVQALVRAKNQLLSPNAPQPPQEPDDE